MQSGATQADVTTAAVNVIVISRTTQFLKYTLMVASHLFLVNIHEPSTV